MSIICTWPSHKCECGSTKFIAQELWATCFKVDLEDPNNTKETDYRIKERLSAPYNYICLSCAKRVAGTEQPPETSFGKWEYTKNDNQNT